MTTPKIIHARQMPGQQSSCRLCRAQRPLEQLSPGGVCAECWAREGALRGWTLIPQGMALVPFQVVQQANVIAAVAAELEPLSQERGVEEPLLMALRRVLEERRRLLGQEREIECCCYCSGDGGDEGLVNLPWCNGFPDLFRCIDQEACKGRINEQLIARHQLRQTAHREAN